MFDSIKLYILGGVAALLLVSYGVLGFEVYHWKHVATERQTELNTSINNYNTLVANTKTAAKEASLEQTANINRVKAEQAQKNEEITNEYQTRINAVTAELDRLRNASRTPASAGSSGSTPVPSVSTAPVSPDPASCRAELLTLDCRAAATYQAIQLDELIKWVEDTHNIKVNPDPNTAPVP